MSDELQMDAFARAIIETITEPLLVLGRDLRVKLANPAFFQWFQVAPEETIGRFIYDLGNKQWDIPALRDLLKSVLSANSAIRGYRVEHDFQSIGNRIMLLNANRMSRVGRDETILLTIEDLTDSTGRGILSRPCEESVAVAAYLPTLIAMGATHLATLVAIGPTLHTTCVPAFNSKKRLGDMT